MKGRINKVCRGLVSLAVAGGLVGGLEGCATLDILDQISRSPAGQALTYNALNTAVTSAVDAGVRNSIEGPRGTTVNVYNNGNGNYAQPRTPNGELQNYMNIKMNCVWNCNGRADINQNGYADSNEFFNIKSNFTNQEKIESYLLVYRKTGKNIIGEIYAPNGEIVCQKRENIVANGQIFNLEIIPNTLNQEGEYTTIWRTDYEEIARNQFKVGII